MLVENDIATKIIGAAIETHKILGPGLLESVYKNCLSYKLLQSGLYVECEKEMPVQFEDIEIAIGYKIDILVENRVVIELKSVEKLTDVHFAQLLTYLKLGDYRLGLLINFNVCKLKDGIRRVVNDL